jgi:3-methyladenine DNA glycosylase AlkD
MEKIVNQIISELKEHIEPEKAKLFPTFFQTHPGGYGEGDQFFGIRVPNIRKVAKNYKNLDFDVLQILIQDKIHEIRMLALFILVLQFEKAKRSEFKSKIANFYIKNIEYVNNWDLVDATAHKILGASLDGQSKSILFEFAKTDSLWIQRIAMIATFYEIRKNQYDTALKIAEILVHHPHDLIHKAVGWMLREIGNRNRPMEEQFLKVYYKTMPRTMLRYAIEKFEPPLRKKYLNGLI